MVAAGTYHTVALKADGTVWAWGWNSYGQLGNGGKFDSGMPMRVNGLTGVQAVAGGTLHSVALKSDGTVWTWGSNGSGRLGNGGFNDSSTPVQVSGLTGVKAIAAGNTHTIALKADGTVWAWGANDYGQLGNGSTVTSSTPVQVNGLTGVQAVATVDFHTVALKADGTVWTWGYNQSGQLGNGTTVNSSTPAQVSGLTGVQAVSAAGSHTVALKSDGTVWTWGSNTSGQLGNGTFNNSTTPVQVTGLIGVQRVSGGGIHTVALKSDGTVWAWGSNDKADLGTGTFNTSTTPLQVSGLSGVQAISANWYHTIALKADGTMWAWGYNEFGQIGDGQVGYLSTPVQVSGLTAVQAVAAGGQQSGNSIALKADGTVWAWGRGDYGQLGNGANADSSVPVQVSALTGVQAVAAGSLHNIALKADGTVRTWGYNGLGQLGNGPSGNSNTPVQVSGLTGVQAIAAGYGHSVALKSDGTVRAWGYNFNGQLGNGGTVNANTPVQVSGLTGIQAVVAGDMHTVALKADGTVWTWGSNSSGQLGNGTFNSSSTPVLVSGISGVQAVAAGFSQTVALKADGTVWAWGSNTWGQLGNGPSAPSSTPVQISGLTGAQAVSTGGFHSVAAKADGMVLTWGYNSDGELGDGNNAFSPTQVQVSAFAGVQAVAAGYLYTIALKQDGTVWTWGHKGRGETGNGSTAYFRTPVQVLLQDLPTPDAFSFTSQTGIALNATVTSNAITVSGINAAATINVSGGTYNINGGAYNAVAGTVNNGDTVTVRLTASGTNNTQTCATLTIGAMSGSFCTTTLDTTPDPFSFTSQTGVALNATVTSSAIFVTGITAAAAISVSGGTYNVNGGAYTAAAGTVNYGNTVTVRLTASGSNSTQTCATLTIGGVSGQFCATTLAGSADTTPDAFSFTSQTGVAQNATVTSNAVTVSGIGAAAAISVSGGTYNVNGGAYTAAAGTVNNGNTVTVRLTASGSNSTQTCATLSIGGVSGQFCATTQAAPVDTTPDAFIFSAQTNVTPDTTPTSNSITVSGINAAAGISVTGGSYSVNGGNYATASGTVNSGNTVSVRVASSANFNTQTCATLTIGGVSAAFCVTTRAVNGPGSLKWSFQTGGAVGSSPAIGADGTVYLKANDGFVYAISNTGSQKWKRVVGGGTNPALGSASGDPISGTSSPAIASDGTVYVGGGTQAGGSGLFYALNPGDGSVKWSSLGTNAFGNPGADDFYSPALGLDGTIYVSSSQGRLYTFGSDGTLGGVLYNVNTTPLTPSGDGQGNVYVCQSPGSIETGVNRFRGLYTIYPNGSKALFYGLGTGGSQPCREILQSIGPGGTIYLTATTNSADLYALNPDKTVRWILPIRHGSDVTTIHPPSVGMDGTLYLLGTSGDFTTIPSTITTNLYAITSSGELNWAVPLGQGGARSLFPAIDANGTVYVGVENKVFAIAPDGTQKWVFTTAGSIESSPAIGADGTIYIGSSDGQLYAINGGSGGLANTSWPMIGGDVRHTGQAGTVVPAAPAVPMNGLLAYYPFNNSAVNLVNSSDSFNVGNNASFVGNALRVNGIYQPFSNSTNVLPGLNYSKFSVSLNFNLDKYPTVGTIVVGGPGYRWFEFGVDSTFHPYVSLNNGATRFGIPSVTLALNTWHTAVLIFDIPSSQIAVYLDGVWLTPIVLPNGFVFNVVGTATEPSDRVIMFTNNSDGGTLSGYVDNLLIYGRTLGQTEAEAIYGALGSGITVPSSPTAVNAVAVNTSATVSFSAPAGNGGTAITGYTVKSSTGNFTANGAGSPITVNGLINGTSYTFTVTATNSAGAGPASAPSNAVTPSAGAGSPADTTVPSVPTGLTATASSASQINLAWNAATDNVGIASYRIYRGGLLIATLGNIVIYSDTGLAILTGYSYTVSACDAAGNCSAQSSSASATTLAAGQYQFTLSLESGFNLGGNALNLTLNIAAIFGNPENPVPVITANVASVWKWNVIAGRWAFYSPQLTAAGNANYAASHNYEVLTTVNPGEGFWMNAINPITLPMQSGTSFAWSSGNFAALPSGFNLISAANSATPSQFNNNVSVTPPSPGVVPTNNFVSLWAWDAVQGKWYFYSPLLESSGGLPAVKAYADSHNYLHFQDSGKTIGIGTGFWVNRP